MSVANDETKRAVLAERIANLVGLPLGNVRSLLPLIPDDDLDDLAEINDEVDFLKESTRLINEASQQQAGGGGEPAAASDSGPGNAAAAGNDEPAPPKKLTITPKAAPNASSPSPGDTSTVNAVNSKAAKKLVLPKPDMAAAGNIEVPDAPGSTGLAVPESDSNALSPEGKPDEPPPEGKPDEPAAPSEEPAPKATVVASAPPEKKSKRGTLKFDTAQVQAPKQESKEPEQEPEPEPSSGPSVAEDGTMGINQAFAKAPQAQEADKPKLDQKSLIMLAVVGGVGLIVVTLLAILVVMFAMSASVVQDSPSTPNNTTQTPDGQPTLLPEVDPPTESAHEWACQFSGEFEQKIPHESLLQGTRQGFTVETWMSASDVYGIRRFSISNSGSQIQFRLGVRQRRGKPMAVFEVPRACNRPVWASIPDGRGWIHLAGVFHPQKEKLQLFVNGRLMNQGSCSQSPRLLAVGYVIKGEMAPPANLQLDEIRFSNRPIYSTSFEPKRILEADESTVSLLHMEQPVDGQIRDAGRKGLKIAVDLTEFVPTDTEDYDLAEDRSLECPEGLLRDMERKYGKATARKFKEDWKNFPDEEKRRLRDKYERRSGQTKNP